MARVHVITDDLLFGSRLRSDLSAAGHEVSLGLAGDPEAELLVLDLTHDAGSRLAALAPPPRPPILAFFAHVETDVRARAQSAGVDLAVPRSRIAREAAALVAGLLAEGR